MHYNIGVNYRTWNRDQDMLQKSIDAFKKATEINEKPAALNNCGISCFELEDYKTTIEQFNSAIKKSNS